MSLQLIVYPQSYDGLSSFTGAGTECVVDGINFNTVNTSASVTSVGGLMPQPYIDAAGTFTVNTWYRFSSVATAVTESSGILTFIGNGTLVEGNGILQRLSNLTVGATYNMTIDFGALNALSINFYHFSGTTQQSATNITGITTQTFSFVAQSTTDTIVFYGLGASFVESISVKKAPISSSGVSLSNGQVICDLYENEDIPLTLSVDEFKNTAEQVKSYSKAFMLPGTKRNNKIFDNLFEITRSDDGVVFNPYVKTQCTLKQDGFVLFEGYLRMIDISDKEGELSYNVNLYSEVIALADVIGERTFSELNFTELDHTYNKTNIKNSWNDPGAAGISYTNPSTSGFRDDNTTLKYPFVNWTNQIPIAPLGGTPNAGMPQLTSFEQVFRPFLQIKYLIDRIFNQPDFPFSYTSTFFSTTDFEKLYMDFNWGSADTPMVFNNTSTGRLPVMTIPTGTHIMPFVDITGSNFGFDDSTYIFTAIQDNQIYNVIYYMHLENGGLGTQNVTVDIEWVATIGGVETIIDPMNFPTIPLVGVIYSGSFGVILNTGDTLKCRVTVSNTYDLHINYNQLALQLSTSANNTTSDSLLQNLRGELGQWEFLKGIITMFNLVTVPDKSNPNNILIEPYNEMFLENTDSSELNWTPKVDVTEIKLKPLTDLKRNTIFKFVEDDDDFAFQNYKNQVGGHLYGSQLFNATIATNGLETILSGEEEIIAEPFAATVPKPLMTQYPQLVVPAIYSYNAEDDTSESFDNSPRIMYNNGKVTMASDTYYIPTQNGTVSENATTFLQFSHLTDIPTDISIPPSALDTRDFHFGICQLIPPIGDPTPNNLFNTYWLPYFNDLYNPDARVMTLKVNLGSGDMNTFKFYDIVMIKNRKFRVNKIEYKPTDLSTVEFILIP
jgi:hypothetical protein